MTQQGVKINCKLGSSRRWFSQITDTEVHVIFYMIFPVRPQAVSQSFSLDSPLPNLALRIMQRWVMTPRSAVEKSRATVPLAKLQFSLGAGAFIAVAGASYCTWRSSLVAATSSHPILCTALLNSRILCGTEFHNIILPIFQSNNFNQFSAAKRGRQFPGHVVSSRGAAAQLAWGLPRRGTISWGGGEGLQGQHRPSPAAPPASMSVNLWNIW